MHPQSIHRDFPVRRLRFAAAATVLGLIVCSPRFAPAQSLAEQAHSLKFVPADAAFYSANLRLKEQWDLLAASRAFVRFMEIPFVNGIRTYAEFQFQESPEPPIAQVREFLASEQGQQLRALVAEMFSDEVFSYGSADLADLIALVAELNSLTRTAQFEALTTGQDPDVLLERRIFEWAQAHQDSLKMPDVVVGFRIRDRARAARLLDVVEQHVQSLLAAKTPEIADRLKRERIRDQEFLTLQLDGSMLPWEEIRGDSDADVDAEQFEKWKTLVAGKTVALAVGLVDEFVVVSWGDSTEHLARLAQAPLLADSPSLVRLNRHAGERIVGLSFGSEAFLSKANSPQRALDDALNLARDAIQQAPISQEQQTDLLENIRGVVNVLARYLPRPGEMSAVGYLTPRGYQGVRYSTGTLPGADSSQPLSLLDHAGASPLLLLATHAGDTVESYDQFVAAVVRLSESIEAIAKEQAPPEDWARYLQFRDRGVSLLRRLDKANREQLYPALRANESAVVVDTASKSTQWFGPMPPSPQPLPLPEIGFVLRVSDVSLLRQGVAEYYSVAQDSLKLLHDMNPDNVPEITLPAPERKSLADGAIYSFPFPADWKVDSQLAFNAGLTNDVAAVSLFPAFTEQLLKPAAPVFDTALDVRRPAAVVSHFQFARLLDAIRPWITYGVAAASGQLTTDEDPDNNAMQQAVMMQAGFIVPQINQFLDVLSAFRSFTSTTHREGDVWVTHTELHLQDLQ